MPEPLQNRDIAEKLGVHTITLSRWRGGQRVPSRRMMVTISEALGWPLSKQMAAYSQEKYAQEFRSFLDRRFGIPDTATTESTEDE